jgi:hypothetical protein
MLFLYILGIIIGLPMIFWGVYALHKKSSPIDIIGGICSIAGLIVVILSTLLICVPHFFRHY